MKCSTKFLDEWEPLDVSCLKSSSSLPSQPARMGFQPISRGGTSTTLFFSDIWEIHGDRLIAFELDTGEILCNRCVYGRDQSNFQFSSTIAKKVSISLTQKHKELEQATNLLQEVAPQKISKHLQTWVSSFLDDLIAEFQEFEKKEGGVECNSNLCPSLKPDFEMSKQIKDRIDHDLRNSFFTRLARDQYNIKREIERFKMAGVNFEASIQKGLRQKDALMDKLIQNQNALK